MTPETTPHGPAGRQRLARAVRALGHRAVRGSADDVVFHGLAARLGDLASSVGDQPARGRDATSWLAGFFAPVEDGEELVHFDDCPVCGPCNPLGLGMRARVDGREVVARVTLGPAHEGAPGRAHGGIVAALFDDLLGYLLTVHQIVAYTGELSVRYQAGVPIGVPVTFRSRVVSQQGRHADLAGEATVDDVVLATARGRFVEPSADLVADVVGGTRAVAHTGGDADRAG